MNRRLAVVAAFSIVVSVAGTGALDAAAATTPAWTIVPTRNVAAGGFNVLGDVTCFSPTNCIAVGGGGTDPLAVKTLVERWNGTTWTTVASASPPAGGQLNAVSCTSDTACFAVGNGGKLGNTPFGERWDGTHWSVVTSPEPAGMELSVPTRVSCSSATACMAVGFSYRQTDGAFLTFAERWDGSRLSIVPTPNGKSGGALHSVTCTSAQSCFAVGSARSAHNTDFAMVARWDGTRWSTVPVPSPPGGKRSTFNALSCTSATACIAAGTWARSTDQFAATFTLVERWNGTRWSYVASPKPLGAGRAEFNSVSCTSAASCMAVGDFVSTPSHTLTTKAFAEQWNGKTWAIVKSPNPAGTFYASLGAVSCSNAVTCMAVGANAAGARQSTTFAEVFR